MKRESCALTILFFAGTPSVFAQVERCELESVAISEYLGACRVNGEPDKPIQLSAAPDAGPFVWRGSVTMPDGREARVSVAPPSQGFYSTGAVQAGDTWLQLTDFEINERTSVLRLSFDWEGPEAGPTSLDNDIIDRARSILSDDSAWDRADDRICREEDVTWSLYCAIRQAASELTGESSHYQPALNVVRQIIRQVANDRTAGHVLMDYNNHPATTLVEVHRLLERADREIRAGFGFVRGEGTLGFGKTPSSAIKVGDIDGDDDLDVLTANAAFESPVADEVFINNGGGTFSISRVLGTDRSFSRDLAVGDLDGDGDLDVAVANDAAPNRLLMNRGDGHFDEGPAFGPADTLSRALAMSDLNGDGMLDIVVANMNAPNEVWLNVGRGQFLKAQEFGAQDSATEAVAVADLDGDEYPDVVIGNKWGQQSYVYLNDGSGRLSEGNALSRAGYQTFSLALGDVNGDGFLDVVTGNDGGLNGIFLGDGAGTFDEGMTFGRPSSRTLALAVGDIDADGDVDIVAGDYESPSSVFLNRGDGRAYDEVEFGPEGGVTGIVLADINGDVYPQILVAYENADNVIFSIRPYR